MSYKFYCYEGMGLDHSSLVKLMNENNFERITDLNNVDYLDFIWVEQIATGYDKRSFTINCFLKNLMEDDIVKKITRKDALYDNMVNKYPSITEMHMAKSMSLFDDKLQNKLINGNVYIIKPVGVGGGTDIKVIKYENYDQIIKIIESKFYKLYKNVVICEYIKDVDTYMGRKYHLRMYLLINAEGKTKNKKNKVPFNWSLCDVGKILTAAEPYKLDDYSNPKIHDTHVKSTPKDFFYPRDMELDTFWLKYIHLQMEKICKYVSSLIIDVKGFPESENAFQVFGMDFLIGKDFTVYLIEINRKVGYDSVLNTGSSSSDSDKLFTPDYKEFSKIYFNWVYEKGIKCYFD